MAYDHLWPGARAFARGAEADIREVRAIVRDLLLEVERLYTTVERQRGVREWLDASEAAVPAVDYSRGRPKPVGNEWWCDCGAMGNANRCPVCGRRP